jgi:hypothetical protein
MSGLLLSHTNTNTYHQLGSKPGVSLTAQRRSGRRQLGVWSRRRAVWVQPGSHREGAQGEGEGEQALSEGEEFRMKDEAGPQQGACYDISHLTHFLFITCVFLLISR